ncbi:hypothetical protein V5P93_005033 [Actinokineospora auranticolor]|uniref:ABC-type branched-subunit amino acid transport system substrate-binding protein n=1 Tax=Actinokineospora auranticolor TaxID=155976 RepID=A0A2S6GK82_9PSEU|nr:hypothetical protein [Actinokineospora auranticolor]PPK65561.1 hypothetical protein CLV40_11345 [Actinokineospora auranticolor]
MSPVDVAPWNRRHPVLTGVAVVVIIASVVVGVVFLVRSLSCGDGMVGGDKTDACVGVNLSGDRFSDDQPERLTGLVNRVQANNDAVTGDNYVSIVLMLNMSPVAGVDTATVDDVYRNVEGALTAVWRANHMSTFSQTLPGDTDPVPAIKLLLANTGSENADWEATVDQIAKAKEDNHITAVTGLSQSTTPTRQAVAKLITGTGIPVIGASVTGDRMNLDVRDESRYLDGFYRIAPTNTGTVVAATSYIANQLRIDFKDVAIVEDNTADDDYIATLIKAAHSRMPGATPYPFTSPAASDPVQRRDDSLKGQFGYMDTLLCKQPPRLVYFAGRGADIGTFVTSWAHSGTCANKPLHLLTGDDALEATVDHRVLEAVATGQVKVQYTALASPDKWGSCPDGDTTPRPDRKASDERKVYADFEAAFTGKANCDADKPVPADGAAPLDFPVDDLATGQSMIAHDAVALAVLAARRAGKGVLADPFSSQRGILQQVRCANGLIPGASGPIRFGKDSHGDPVGVVLPIMDIGKSGKATTVFTGLPTTDDPNAGKDC